MRIAFDSQTFAMQQHGGISRYICSLAKGLSTTTDVEAKIFAGLHVNDYLAHLPSSLVSGGKVPKIPRTSRVLRAVNRVLTRQAMNGFHPDIVHETYYYPAKYGPSSALRVVTVHDMTHERFADMFSPSDKSSEWKRIATHRADHVICISENTRRDLLELFDLPEEKLSVIYHGYDYLTPPDSSTPVKLKPFLLYVGHRGGHKNYERFLRAYASSAWLRDNFDVVCFGGGSFSRVETGLIAELQLSADRVTQIGGSDSTLATYYRDAAVFVYPSLYEGFGIPPLEAMSLGCPVVCSNASSIPEVVGDAGEYFDPSNIESIRMSIEKVLSSAERRDELVQLGQSRCATFTWERCVDQTLAIYNGLI